MNLTELIAAKVFQNRFGEPDSRLKLFRTKFDKDGGNNIIYIGFAPRLSATSDKAWVIVRFTYNINDDPTDIEISTDNVAWDDRKTSVVYG